jgi:hypothetical protein
MALMQIVVLVCNVAVPQADCSRLTAVDYFYGPEAPSEIECMRASMQFMASLAVNKGADEYHKVLCQRVKGEENVGRDEGDGTVQVFAAVEPAPAEQTVPLLP